MGEWKMHYVDEGGGEPVVLVHGDPTWGYLYRKFIPPLAGNFRCIVPDHMGMGKSGVPKTLYPYRLLDHINNSESLMESLNLIDITLVLHDWGGPVGLGFAIRHLKLIKRLVLMNTWAFVPWPGGPFPHLLEIIRSDRGENFVLQRNGYVKRAILGTTYKPSNITKEILNAYLAPFPTPDSRLALLCWSRDIPVNEEDTSYQEMKKIQDGLYQFKDFPILLLWGMQDPVLPPSVLHLWQEIYPNASVYQIDHASHFLQEDASDEIVGKVQTFLRTNH
ncbi:alpha/beta fold hydrolase [Desulfobacterota bacterium AH_259_B03_O07]|nr:alpha/beta fold hydrolase [Desulfobacterota bacterium AH_259_B03_O07]